LLAFFRVEERRGFDSRRPISTTFPGIKNLTVDFLDFVHLTCRNLAGRKS